MTQDLKPEAVHESAHFLAALLAAGARVNSISCVPGNHEVRSSHRAYTSVILNSEHPETKQALVVMLAGPAGEEKYTGHLNLQAAEIDIGDATVCLSLKGRPEVEQWDDFRFYNEFSSGAKAFVSHPLRWKMIRHFAKHLQVRCEMSGREAVEWIQKEASTWPANEQLEFWFPQDQLAGGQLPLEEHKL